MCACMRIAYMWNACDVCMSVGIFTVPAVQYIEYYQKFLFYDEVNKV